MENSLWKIFDNVNKWLDYAEKKNSLILTILAVQLTLLKLLSPVFSNLFILSLFFLSLCLIISIISFFPTTSIQDALIKVIFWNPKKFSEINIIFYGDIAKLSKVEYIKLLENSLKGKIFGDEYLESICIQIIANAVIALRKYNLFKICTFLMIFGQILFIISFF